MNKSKIFKRELDKKEGLNRDALCDNYHLIF